MKEVSDKVAHVTNILVALADRENEIRAQRESIKDEIHVTVKEINNTLQQQLIGNLNEVTGSKLLVLSEPKKSAEMKLSKFEECKESVTKNLMKR